MRRLLFSLMILTVTLLTTFHADANKGVSGGNGAGGTLLDPQTYEQAERIDGQSLESILQTEFPTLFKAYPFFDRLTSALTTQSHARYWFLEERALNPDCLNAITWHAPQEILACQNQVEVRIKKSWWLQAPQHERAALLLHEILTALRFSDEKFETVPMAVSLLLNPNFDPASVSDELGRLRFPDFITETDLRESVPLLRPHLDRLCKAKTRAEHLKADLAFEKILDHQTFGSYRSFQLLLVTRTYLRDLRMDGPITCKMSDENAQDILALAWLKRALP